MKKYFFGIVAIGLAIGFTAFTAPSKKFATVTVVFDGDPLVQNEVNDPTLWKVITVPTCSGSQKACRFDIDDSNVTTGQSPNHIKTTVSISSTGDETNGFRPTSASVSISNILNKP